MQYITLAIFCGCTARFVSDLVGDPEDRFSQNEAQLMKCKEMQSLPSPLHTRVVIEPTRVNINFGPDGSGAG